MKAMKTGRNRGSFSDEIFFENESGTREYSMYVNVSWYHDSNADCDADGNRGHDQTDCELSSSGPVTTVYRDGRTVNVCKRFARWPGAVAALTQMADEKAADYVDNCRVPRDEG